MIVVLRCFGGNTVLTAAQFSLVFRIPGRREGGRVGTQASMSAAEAENSRLMNEFSLPRSSKPGNIGALTEIYHICNLSVANCAS